MALQPIGENYDVVQFDRPDKSSLNTGEKWLQPIQSPKDNQQWSKSPQGAGGGSTVLYDPVQNQIATASRNGTVVAVDAVTGAENWSHTHHNNDSIENLTYDPEFNRIVSVSGNKSLPEGEYLSVDAETGELHTTDIFNHWNLIYDSAFDSTQKRIVTGDDDGVVVSAKAGNLSKEWEHSLHGNAEVHNIIYDPAQNQILSGDINGTVICVDATDGSQQWSKNLLNNLTYGLAYNPLNNNVVAAAGKMVSVSAIDGSEQWSVPLSGGAYAATHNLEHNQIITGSPSGTVNGFDATNGAKKWSHSFHTEPVYSVSVDSAQNNVVSIDGNGDVISASLQIKTNKYVKQNGQLMLINSTI
jgi:hypothetical protein